MYAFNDTRPAANTYRLPRLGDLAPRTRLVDIHAWCLMGNHYHLLLSERVDKGISLFLRKLNVGYANYFNERYKRNGALFQGRTKKILIANDAHFLHILHYIHLNPLDFLEGAKEWRALKIGRSSVALAHLDAYRWSSYRDYCGERNFGSLITKDLFNDVFGNYRKVITAYLKDVELEGVRPLLLE